jgi:hypothetical protein
MRELSLNFISGSKERSLEIFELIRKADREYMTRTVGGNM